MTSSSNRTCRTWEPMSIGPDEVFPILIVDPEDQNLLLPRDPPRANQDTIVESNVDGQSIVHRDHSSVVASTSTGAKHSEELNDKISRSNKDRIDDLTIVSAHVHTPSAPDMDTNNTTCQKQGQHRKGYEIAEYKSVYEHSGGYQFAEYKSIYDN